MNGDEDFHERAQRERVGVAGDPTPDREYGDQGRPPGADVDPADGYPNVSRSVLRSADEIASHGVVTYRQAVAWVLRVVEGVGREEAAERMDSSVSNLDTLLGRARENIESARRTAEVADELEADE